MPLNWNCTEYKKGSHLHLYTEFNFASNNTERLLLLLRETKLLLHKVGELRRIMQLKLKFSFSCMLVGCLLYLGCQ